MSKIDYSARIPNNVDLAGDRRLQRALESWQPDFLDWWAEMGPVKYQDNDIYLRTAIDTSQEGWAQFDHVKLADYRFGIFLSDPEPDRRIGFGEFKGEPAWQEIPGEFRSTLRRLIVVQGDTEPASVEQQRHLGLTAPSGYDLRNLFQVNVEEARHLWAMVYLLHGHFGRDGRDEADAMLKRHSGDPDSPRILGAFNEKTPDWLSFYLFTYFTDRDGKYQLGALRESAFDPLSRTCDFMLKEEAHHMFVGATGVGRIIQRTTELMNEHNTFDVRPYGAIDLDTLQRYVNFHYSVSVDLFGSELSTNAATYYTTGLKGRFNEMGYDDDHVLSSLSDSMQVPGDDGLRSEDHSALALVNQTLRDDYTEDCMKGVRRWNRILGEAGIDYQLTLPHQGFNRHVGVFGEHHVTPEGQMVDEDAWNRNVDQWLPSDADRDFVVSLMQPVGEAGKMAAWIAPPAQGINGQPVDFEYVKL
ncbi:MAG: benzoyl-CoA 2,3-epoxidase subunit BoxB [Actinomycetia bacterium]|nr:benzoyl-CoA 2,3-epoxidase subunit BoxB [Actinomycetes bacterium]MCP3910626.1 benzoyl-CoA 2,3-epoxidase subunit BoxB [Actinomycetes bacterium]MCP4084747.1 benzoyl-CoA 2,3-epoxidase subunit BoxB [Actinomycetes bacterium]